MAVTDEEFRALAGEVDGPGVRALEDARVIDRAEAEVRHRAVIDSMQALRLTQVDQGREIGKLRADMERQFKSVDLRFDLVQETLGHVVRLLERDGGPGDGSGR